MPIKRFKDESKCLAKWKMKAGKRHYFHVFLWESKQAFDENTCDNEPGEALGCCNNAPSIIEIGSDGSEREIIRPKLGEVHFIKDTWNMEIVAHELFHAIIQQIRMIGPKADDIVEQIGDSEEDICYTFGRWMHEIYSLLWEVNPYGRWK